MGSLMNWFFVLTFISLTTTFFITTLNSEVNTDLKPDTENPDIINDYVSSGSIVIYDTNFFGNKNNEVALIGINDLQSSDEATIQLNNEDYLTVFMNTQGVVFTAEQGETEKYVAELAITRSSDSQSLNDEFDIYLQENLINQGVSSVEKTLFNNKINEVIIDVSNINTDNPRETIDFTYSEVYTSESPITNLGKRLGDNVLGNLLTGIGGMPAWFNALFAIMTSMTVFMGILIARGVN